MRAIAVCISDLWSLVIPRKYDDIMYFERNFIAIWRHLVSYQVSRGYFLAILAIFWLFWLFSGYFGNQWCNQGCFQFCVKAVWKFLTNFIYRRVQKSLIYFWRHLSFNKGVTFHISTLLEFQELDIMITRQIEAQFLVNKYLPKYRHPHFFQCTDSDMKLGFQ